MIQAGLADVVVAGGMESMTNAPYLLPDARAGMRIGDKSVVDSMMYDGLFCAFDQCAMGAGTEKYAASAGLGRERAGRSWPPSPTSVPPGPRRTACSTTRSSPSRSPSARATPWSSPTTRACGPTPRSSRSARCAPPSTRPATSPPATPSQISDGGAAVVVASKAAAERIGGDPLGEIVGYGQVAGPDASLLTQPSRAILQAPRAGRAVRVRRRPVRAERGLRRRRRGLR